LRVVVSELPVAIFSVLGVINAIGPCAAGPAETVYAWIEFIESGGKVRRVGNVIAGAEIARLVEPDAIGAWYLHGVGGSHRILGAERADGPRALDYDAIHACIPHWLAELRASRTRVPAH
jgi:hypothetical protein